MHWSKIRKSILERDKWRCVECGSNIRGRNAHVHHKLPKAIGGSNEPENLISLCSSCHSLKHMNLQASLGRRLIERLAFRIAKIFDPETLSGIRGDQLGIALRYLKVKRLREGQLQPILAALAGKSVLFISPTGSGKSLCFQLPALIKPNKSIVISPLKALMSDQVGGLLNREFPATFINSDLPKHEKDLRLELIAKNKFKLVYLAPERLEESKSRIAEHQALFREKPAFLIVDEAHVIDKWGDLFRPQYANISKALPRMGRPPVLAFTATAGIETRKQILSSLKMHDAEVFVEGVDRPNIALARFQSHDDRKRASLIKKLFHEMRSRTNGKALVFVPTVKKGELVKELLNSAGLKTEFFHGKLQAKDRDFILGRFDGRLDDPIEILICTNAFGMGMDIPNVRIVFHWQHPSSAEDYLQEFGRAGRDGKQSLAVLFTQTGDHKTPDFLLRKSLDNLRLNEHEYKRLYKRKSSGIKLISHMSNSTSSCFTKMLRSELDVQRTQSGWLVRFILELVFASRQKVEKRRFCCDGCHRKMTTAPVSEFALKVIQSMK